MKTKLIILAAAGSAIVFSCTNDRNEEESVNPAPNAKVIELKKLEINQGNQTTLKLGDSIIVAPPPKALNSTNGDGEGLPPNPDTSEGDPKDVPPRK